MMRREHTAITRVRAGLSRVASAPRRKLANTRGDSFAEVLVSILIAALGAAMLASMISAATGVTTRSQNKLADLHQAESNLATGSGGATAEGVTEGVTTTKSVKITIQQKTGDGIRPPFPTVEVDGTLIVNDDFSRYVLGPYTLKSAPANPANPAEAKAVNPTEAGQGSSAQAKAANSAQSEPANAEPVKGGEGL